MSKKYQYFFIMLCTSLIFFSCISIPKPGKNAVEEMRKLLDEKKFQEAKKLFQEKNDVNEIDKKGNTAAHIAALYNDVDLISFLLFKGADSNIKNFEGNTPLHTAIKSGSRECAQILCKSNPNIFSKDGNGKTALELALEKGSEYYPVIFTSQTGEERDEINRNLVHYIVEAQDENALKYCIKKGLPISYVDNDGNSPLKLAYKNNTDDGITIASQLLLAGAVPERAEYGYFEDCQKIHNVSLRFDDGQTPLHFAAIYGHTAIAKFLLKNGASPKAKDILGSTPLHEAARYGHKDILKLLLQNGADPNSQDSLGKTPLLLIIPKENRFEICSTLLTYGANPNAKDMYGDTPLHLATMTRMEKTMLETLKNGGADINERNKKGITPMALAINNLDRNLVIFYAENNADIHAEDNEGNTPLSRLLENSDKEALDLLKKMINEHNINSRDSYGNTPLHIAVNRNANLGHVKYLISLCNDVNIRNRNGDTPLYLAAQKNRKQLGELLLKNNGDVFCTNNENYSPLRIALSSGGEAQEWILASEIIKKTDGTGNTPLHYAAEWKLDNAVSVLLSKGADANVKNSNGETPIFNAIKSDSTSTIDLLLRKNAKKNERDYLGNTPMHNCIRWNAKNSAMKLIQWKADLNLKNLAGKTPLAQAAHSGRIALATLLLENGANIDETDATGKTVLIDAIQSNSTEMVAMLLKKGASPQVQEIYGRNAYHEAVFNGNINIIKLVRQYGGNPLSRDAQGITPFSLAIKQSPEIIAAVLGDSKNLMDSDGNTPVHIAIENGAPDSVINYLLTIGFPINARNRNGSTALSIAVEKNNPGHVRSLLLKDADPFIESINERSPLIITLEKSTASTDNFKLLDTFIEIMENKTDYQGEGIIHYAAKIADKNTIQHILEKNIDRTVRNINGETASDIAIRWGRKEIGAMLK